MTQQFWPYCIKEEELNQGRVAARSTLLEAEHLLGLFLGNTSC